MYKLRTHSIQNRKRMTISMKAVNESDVQTNENKQIYSITHFLEVLL